MFIMDDLEGRITNPDDFSEGPIDYRQGPLVRIPFSVRLKDSISEQTRNAINYILIHYQRLKKGNY
mgnify:CR=1 FL=1